MSTTPKTDAFLNGRLPCTQLERELIEFARSLEMKLDDMGLELKEAMEMGGQAGD